MRKNRARYYRKYVLRMTQSEMAGLFKISQQAYAQKEKGIRDFKMEEMTTFRDRVSIIIPEVTVDEIFFASE